MTISFNEGNGVLDDQYALNIALPDANGGSIAVNGNCTAQGLSQVAVSGTVNAPTAPGSGLIYFNIQIDPTNGSVALLQSTSAQPAPATAADGVSLKRIVYNTVIAPANTDPALDAGTTPDNPANLP